MSWHTQVVAMIAKMLRVDPQKIGGPEVHLTRDLGLQSMQVVELVELIERHAGQRIPIDELFLASPSGPDLAIGELVAWLDARFPLKQ
jgi:acyl carrier protein